MVIETFSPEETEELGIHFGKEAKPGTVCTLTGDLGVGKTVFTQGIAKVSELQSRSTARRLRSYRSMRRAGCHFTISMSTGSEISKKWMRSDMRTIFMGTD